VKGNEIGKKRQRQVKNNGKAMPKQGWAAADEAVNSQQTTLRMG
jgi:hypothetical protein